MTKTARKTGGAGRRPAASRDTRHAEAAADGAAFVSDEPTNGAGPEPSAAEITPKPSKALLYRWAVHAAGLAVVGLCLDLGRIARITIDAPEGGVITWTADELHEQTEQRVTAVLVALLAGRAAEEEFLESAQASRSGLLGASDLGLATELAYDMEAVMGFGKKWPLLQRATLDRTHLLTIDQELAGRVNARLDAAYAFTRKMVARQRPAIEFLAAFLVSHRTLEGAELAQVLEEVWARIVP